MSPKPEKGEKGESCFFPSPHSAPVESNTFRRVAGEREVTGVFTQHVQHRHHKPTLIRQHHQQNHNTAAVLKDAGCVAATNSTSKHAKPRDLTSSKNVHEMARHQEKSNKLASFYVTKTSVSSPCLLERIPTTCQE